MVPEGWKETYLGDVITHKKGFAFNSGLYRDKGIRIVRISDTTRNSVHSENPVYLAEEYAEGLESYKLAEDDIILSTVGSRPHLLDSMVGKAVKVPLEAGGSLLNQNLVKVIPKASKITNEYLFEMLKNKRFIFFISTLVRGNANQVSITLADLFQYHLVLPPLPEQKKIAQILSTWDKAITTTEQLLANSQQQKKALMQQLLTGKKRLLDHNGVRFGGEWKHKRLLSLCSIKTGKKDVNEGNPEGKYPFFTCASEPTRSDNYSYDCEAILVAGNGILGKTHYFKGKFEAYQRTYILSGFNDIDVHYLHQFILYWLMRDIEREKQHGAMPYIKLGLLQNFKVLLPCIEEQQKIAAVLSVADQEVTSLQQKLDTLKQEKKALMQQLLTGKRRVRVDEAA
ncbi:MAG: restriction endonuclease subunit S [Anaerolineaceae bacterium]|nr:restriction endonuclease subunit S [Anaerolineaceae bacterium]